MSPRAPLTFCLLALTSWLPACASSTGTADGGDAVVAADVPQDAPASNPCAPGTCRFVTTPDAACQPPGGPVGPSDGGLVGCCSCGPDGFCNGECICAAPDTPIATPAGPRPIASLVVGDRVLSVHQGRVVAVPLREVRRRPVASHRVMRVQLASGAVLRISAAHPTADGRTFGALRAGDWLGGQLVRAVDVVAYEGDATYDILPDSDTGTYYVGGALIGSTLAPPPARSAEGVAACIAPPRIARP